MKNKDIKPLFDKGIEALSQGHTQVAIESFNEILRNREDFTLAYYQLSNVYIYLQDWEKAEKHLDVVMDLEPEWSHGFYSAGKVACMRGYFDDAVGFFSTAIKLGFKVQQGVFSRGIALHGCGRLAEAIDDFDSVLIEGLDITALQYRMACFLGMHRYQEALNDVEMLIELQEEKGDKANLEEIRTVCKQQLQVAPTGERIHITELDV